MSLVIKLRSLLNQACRKSSSYLVGSKCDLYLITLRSYIEYIIKLFCLSVVLKVVFEADN